jgi:retron-type reverse transcriptase
MPEIGTLRSMSVLEPIFEADFEDNAYGYRPRATA